MLHVDCNLNILLSNGECHQAMNGMSPIVTLSSFTEPSALVLTMRIAIWSTLSCFCYLLSVTPNVNMARAGLCPWSFPSQKILKAGEKLGVD